MPTENDSQAGWVYFIRCIETDLIKIGFTGSHPKQRFANLRTANGASLILIGTINGSIQDERALHDRFWESRSHGEWFRRTPELDAFILVMAEPPVTYSFDADMRFVLEGKWNRCSAQRWAKALGLGMSELRDLFDNSQAWLWVRVFKHCKALIEAAKAGNLAASGENPNLDEVLYSPFRWMKPADLVVSDRPSQEPLP